MSLFPAARRGRVASLLVASLWLACVGGPALAQSGTSSTSTPASSAARFSAIVRGVLDDGTVAISLGSVLTPVRLSGVVLMPGAIPAIQKALPVGAHVYVQIVEKGQPAKGLIWVKSQILQDLLLAQKLAVPAK